MPFRVSIRSVQVAGRKTGGYSENFWNSGADLTTVEAATVALADRLLNFKGGGMSMPTARISATGSFRVIKIVDLALVSALSSNNAINADYPTTKLQLKLSASGAQGPIVVTQWIGSIRDGICERGGQLLMTAAALTAFNQVKAQLLSNGWALRTLVQGTPLRTIASITVAGVVTTTVAHGYATDDRVRIMRTKTKVANRIWKIQAIDATSFQLIGFSSLGLLVAPDVSRAVAQLQVYDYKTITGVAANQISKHNVGRPSDLFVGRR